MIKASRPRIATNRKSLWGSIYRNRALYLLLLPAVVILFCFTYIPMYGVTIAFKDFTPALGINGSPWAGLKYFRQYFNSYQFATTIKNTLIISLYSIVVSFPLPIIIALMCNQMMAHRFRKVFQVTTYLPHFISTVVMCGMILLFLSPSTGVIAKLLSYLGYEMPNLMGNPRAFSSIYVWTDIWQHTGWDSIMYIAALSAIDISLYEAATVDGASKWQKTIHIDIPLLLPTATVLFILRTGSIMSVGFEKVFLLQNSLNLPASEIISTYVYKMGLISNQYSLSSAINLFNNIINFVLLLSVNWISGRLSETSLL